MIRHKFYWTNSKASQTTWSVNLWLIAMAFGLLSCGRPDVQLAGLWVRAGADISAIEENGTSRRDPDSFKPQLVGADFLPEGTNSSQTAGLNERSTFLQLNKDGTGLVGVAGRARGENMTNTLNRWVKFSQKLILNDADGQKVTYLIVTNTQNELKLRTPDNLVWGFQRQKFWK